MSVSAKPSKFMPIRPSPNGRYFVDRKGKPFFWLADTLWHLLREYTPADVAAIVRNRKSKGIIGAQIMLIGYEGEPKPNINGDMPWIGNDPSKPNSPYWEYVDECMQAAAKQDFVLILGVYHKSQGRFYTPAKAKSAARWIAARYKNIPQVIWSMYPEAKNSYIPICRALAAGLQAGDGGRHLITVHPDPSPTSSSFLHNEKWLAFNSNQPWNDIDAIYSMTASDYGFTPIKPVVMAEGAYEAAAHLRLITPTDVRRQAWWSWLAGGYHSYGHSKNHEDPTHWRDWIDSAGSCHLKTFRQIITALPKWWTVIPDQSIVWKTPTTMASLPTMINPLVAAAHSQAADWAIVYFAAPATAMIRMDRIKTSERIAATWINPITGDKTPAGEFVYEDKKPFTTPQGWEDAVLLLKGSRV